MPICKQVAAEMRAQAEVTARLNKALKEMGKSMKNLPTTYNTNR